MQTLPISTVKSKLSELVDTAENTHEEYAITVNGAPVAMLVGMSEWESLHEQIFWLSQPDIVDDVARARAEIAAGSGLNEEEIRARFGAPKRTGR
ncbi:type II toxin-antitoxin system Phd/YefM family antitoxin [Subtercola lobariae]|uniref:Antitoxin n=1 Tax=Subtercola lobariae TaxID=1588641 RepID=A0A917B3S1_9MICO|nr:type II toxin-antitoxin system Phd/YefM family antitoxin [Subtercola lobariae]GGF17698.1 antitoxin [Subtercola lobariae]